MKAITLSVGIMALLLVIINPANAWDSVDLKNPTHATHSRFTEYAVNEVKLYFPECGSYEDELVAGANCEMHELPIKLNSTIKKYCPDLETKRVTRYWGTNPGCEHPELIWTDALKAYKAGKKDKAFFMLGVLFHQIQDMGVPAHANDIPHQGNLKEFDNFEALGVLNWKPDFTLVEDLRDPKLKDPSAYYKHSRYLCHEDAPDYTKENHSKDKFAKTWLLASDTEKRLFSRRQASVCYISQWALESAMIAFLREEESKQAKSSTPKPVVPVSMEVGPGIIHRLGTPSMYGSDKEVKAWVNGKELRTSVTNEMDLKCSGKGAISVRASSFACWKDNLKADLRKYVGAKVVAESPTVLKWTNPGENVEEGQIEAVSEECKWEFMSSNICQSIDYHEVISSSYICPVAQNDTLTFVMPKHPERAIVKGDTQVDYRLRGHVRTTVKRTIRRSDGTVKTSDKWGEATVNLQITVPTAPGRPDLFGLPD